MYTKKDICAVIISFNCDETLLKNVSSLCKQVERVIVIDNNSTDELSIKLLKQIECNKEVEVIYDSINRGVAAQLNQGLQKCIDYRYALMLSMDQDTVLCDHCVVEMLKVINENNNIMSVGPNRQTKNTSSDNYKIVNYLITSGNLVQVKSVIESGGFFEDLFIDLVDIDFSLSLRRKGYQLAMVNNAFMHHKVGEYESNILLGHNVSYLTHSAKRFYYIYRNSIIVFRKFFKRFPVYCLKILVFQSITFIKFLILERDKRNKLLMIKNGLIDGVKYKFQKLY